MEYVYTTQIAQGEYDMILALPLDRARIELSLRQPSWLTRSEWETVRSLDPSNDEELVVEYLLECKDLIRRRIEGLAKYQHEPEADVKPDLGDRHAGSASGSGHGQTKSCLERVWFWFPSLSSKEKRRDLITFAEEHLLSGFLLAGELRPQPTNFYFSLFHQEQLLLQPLLLVVGMMYTSLQNLRQARSTMC